MWFQTLPATNRWVLHVAATPAHVTTTLRDLRIDDQQPHDSGDEQFPVYLRGVGGPYGPPTWMAFARAELDRRGYDTRWCTPECRHHLWPPGTDAEQPRADAAATPASRPRRRGSAAHGRPRTPQWRLTRGVPHHRTGTPTPAATAAQQPVAI